MNDSGLAYLAPGIRVDWYYTHAIGKNRMTRVKSGTVVRTIKHRNRFYKQQIAIIFDGNKEESIVHINQVRIKESK